MKLSLSWKVNAIIVMVVALVLLGAGGYEISQTWQQLLTNLENTSIAIIKRLTVTLVNPMWAFNDDDILTFMQGEMQNEHVLAIEVKRPVGQNKHFLLTRDDAWQVVSQPEAEGDITSFIVKKSNIERAGEVLGTVTVYMTDRFINEEYQAHLVTLLIRTVVLLLFIVLTLFVLIERVVVRPVRTLTHQAQVIAGGTLDEAIVTQRGDELGILADSFEVMRRSIKEKMMALHDEITERQRAENQVRELNEDLEQRVVTRTQQLAARNMILTAQNAISATISQSLDLATILGSALSQVLVVMHLDAGLIYLLEADKINLTVQTYAGLSDIFVAAVRQIKVGEGVSGQAVASKEPRIFELANYPTARLSQAIINENLQVIISVPLIAQSEAVGALTLGVHHAHSFSEQDLALLVAIGQQVGVAVENAQLYQLLQQANHELVRLNGDKDRFFSIVAHDLKGPFMPLLGNAELLTEMGDILPPLEIKQLGASIQRTARNVFNLLENLLYWARLQMGRMEYQPQRLDLAEIAAKTVELLSGNAVIKQIDLHSEVKPETWVCADENMLDTVIRNLTNNALKFTPQKGQVTILANQKDGFVEVAIADTGVGIPEQVKQKLFKIDEHVTMVGTGKETGTGLGLIICQEMVVKSGGHIWVESEVGRGTTVKFTVRLDGID